MNPMPSASLFSLPLPPWQQPLSVRVAKYEPRKRRKGSDDWDTDVDDAQGKTTDAASVSEVTPSGPDLILSPEEAHQYRIAGLFFDKELPAGNFPHAAPGGRAKRETEKDILKGLSSLAPPLYPPQSAAQQGNLRFQHLAVITAILHRCLLQGDYIRAGRAWGLILREEFGGRAIDARNGGRWGIGAEILLRRGRQISDIASGQMGDSGNNTRLWFTRGGFEDAKRYYERLIIQHPFRKAAPDAISSLHFYPAMFGLWIYVVQEESNAAREEIQQRPEESSEWPSEDEETGSEFGPRGRSGQKRQGLVTQLRAKELEQAQQIAARMDETLISPPYSDSPELLELRGMVSLWIADLLVSSLPQEEGDWDDVDNNSEFMFEEEPDSIIARREQRLAMERRETELQKSREFFEKAGQRGRGVAYTLEHLHIDETPPLL